MRWIIRLIFVLLILAAAWLFVALTPHRSDAQPLRYALLNEIAHAKEIRVIEHSNRWDYLPRENPVHHEEQIYKAITLNPTQRDALTQALVPYTELVGIVSAKMCIFEPHHRIEIVGADNNVRAVEICLLCGQLDAGSGQTDLPDGWDKSLRTFISSLSMRPDGPWIINETSSEDSK